MTNEIKEEHSETVKRKISRKRNTKSTSSTSITAQELSKKQEEEYKEDEKAKIVESERGNKRIFGSLDLLPKQFSAIKYKVSGIVIVALILGYLIGVYDMKLGYLVIVAYAIQYFFDRRIRQYSYSMRYYYASLFRHKISKNVETVEWLNNIISKIWINCEEVVSSEVHSQVNEELRKIKVPGILGLRLSECTFGTKPPEVEEISFISDKDNLLDMTVSLSFIPLQDDVLSKSHKNSFAWNSFIQLNCDINSFLTIPVLVRNFSFAAKIRIRVEFCKKIPILKKLFVQMAHTPNIDFVLIPLKIFDLMDIPFIRKILFDKVNNVLKELLIAPKFFEIPLDFDKKEQGDIIGVVVVNILRIESNDEGGKRITLDCDGKKVGETLLYEGNVADVNETFSVIVKNTTRNIGLTLHESIMKQNFIWLRNLNRHFYAETLVFSSEIDNSVVRINSTFLRLENEQPTSSGIVTVNILNASNLRVSGYTDSAVYNTYLIVSFIDKTAKDAEFTCESKRVFSTKEPIFNLSVSYYVKDFESYKLQIELMEESTNNRIGYAIVEMIDIYDRYEISYKLRKMYSGEISVNYSIKYVKTNESLEIENMKFIEDNNASNGNNVSNGNNASNGNKDNQDNGNNVSKENIRTIDDSLIALAGDLTCDEDRKNSPLLSSINIYDCSTDINGEGGSNNTKLLSSLPKLSVSYENLPSLVDTGIYNLDHYAKNIPSIKFGVKITVSSISKEGSFRIVFESTAGIYETEIFSSQNFLPRAIVIPLCKNDTVILSRIFKLSENGDVLISEKLIELDVGKDSTLCLFYDKIKLEYKIEYSDVSNGMVNDKNYKFVLFNLKQIHREISDNISLNMFISLAQLLRCRVYVMKGSHGIILRNISRKVYALYSNCKETFLNGKGMYENFKKDLMELISRHFTISVYGTGFRYIDYVKKGILTVYVISIKTTGRRISSDVLLNEENEDVEKMELVVEVLCNRKKVFLSSPAYGVTNFNFNEGFEIPIHKLCDKLTFNVFHHRLIGTNSFLCYKEISLFNLLPDYTNVSLTLLDSRRNIPMGFTLKLVFSLFPIPSSNESSSK